MDKKKPSIEEILAMARQQKAGGGEKSQGESKPADDASVDDAAAASPTESAPAAAAPKPATPKPKAAPGGAGSSVADILAAARAQKAAAPAGEAKPKPATEKAVTEKPAKPAAAKPAAAAKPPAKSEPAEAAGAAASTASILDALRGDAKRGPKSKAEAGVPSGEKTAAADEPVKAKPKAAAPPMPPKPDYAKKPAPGAKAGAKGAGAKGTSEERRGVVLMLGVMVGTFLGVGFTSLAATLSMWLLGTARFMFPNIITEPPSRFKVGLPAEFPFGQVSEKFKAAFGVWVVNGEYNGQRQIFALSTICTHLGCTPNWLEAEQKFKCPCHGSGFYKDGINFEGPAPRPLERYGIRLAEDGQLEVDKSKKFQEEKGEWTKADSFVTG